MGLIWSENNKERRGGMCFGAYGYKPSSLQKNNTKSWFKGMDIRKTNQFSPPTWQKSPMVYSFLHFSHHKYPRVEGSPRSACTYSITITSHGRRGNNRLFLTSKTYLEPAIHLCYTDRWIKYVSRIIWRIILCIVSL